MAAHDAKM